MPTERSPHQQWADAQRTALLELGYDLVDVQARITWILDNLPPDADPATHIFAADELYLEPSDPEQVMDARVAWIADEAVGARWKLILDAKAENES